MLDVHRLRVFRAVVAAGSVQAAADNLGFTPSAISQHLTALQRETGLALFAKSGRGIVPTSAGLRLAESVDPLLADLGSVESVVRDLREGRSGTLRIASIQSVSVAWFPSVLATLRQRHPELRVELLAAGRHRVTGESVDIEVAAPDVVPATSPGLRIVQLATDPYVAVVPHEHRLYGVPTVDLADLAGETWIDNDVTDSGCRRRLLAACHAAGFTPEFQVETQDHVSALQFVKAGLGISVVPKLCLEALPEQVGVVELRNPTPERTIVALVDASTRVGEAAALVVQELQRRGSGAQARP